MSEQLNRDRAKSFYRKLNILEKAPRIGLGLTGIGTAMLWANELTGSDISSELGTGAVGTSTVGTALFIGSGIYKFLNYDRLRQQYAELSEYYPGSIKSWEPSKQIEKKCMNDCPYIKGKLLVAGELDPYTDYKEIDSVDQITDAYARTSNSEVKEALGSSVEAQAECPIGPIRMSVLPLLGGQVCGSEIVREQRYENIRDYQDGLES